MTITITIPTWRNWRKCTNFQEQGPSSKRKRRTQHAISNHQSPRTLLSEFASLSDFSMRTKFPSVLYVRDNHIISLTMRNSRIAFDSSLHNISSPMGLQRTQILLTGVGPKPPCGTWTKGLCACSGKYGGGEFDFFRATHLDPLEWISNVPCKRYLLTPLVNPGCGSWCLGPLKPAQFWMGALWLFLCAFLAALHKTSSPF